MTSRHKETVKSLKAPDKFQVQAITALDWGVKNARILGMVLAPLVVVVAGVFAVKYWNARQKEARLVELGKVQVLYDAEARKAGDAHQALQKQIEALDAPPAVAKDGALPAKDAKPAVPDAKTAAAKAALQKQAELIRPDHADSAAKFVEYYKKYPTHPEGWLAGMEASHIFMDEEKLADARPLLEEIVEKSKGNDFYQIQGRLALTGLYEEAGDYDKGLGQVEALDKLVDPDLKPKVMLTRGRLQMLKNAKADAKATFNSIIENHAASPEAQKARSLIALLNG